MTDQEIEKHQRAIDQMTHRDMAVLHRFGPIGHPYMDHRSPLSSYFYRRFERLGGMTVSISKSIGWGKPATVWDPAPGIQGFPNAEQK